MSARLESVDFMLRMRLCNFAALQGGACQQTEEKEAEEEEGRGEGLAGFTMLLLTRQSGRGVQRQQGPGKKGCIESVSQTWLKHVCHSNIGSQGSNLPAPLQQPYVLVHHTH